MCASCYADRVFGVLLHWQAEWLKNVQRVVVYSGQHGSINVEARNSEKLYFDYLLRVVCITLHRQSYPEGVVGEKNFVNYFDE